MLAQGTITLKQNIIQSQLYYQTLFTVVQKYFLYEHQTGMHFSLH